MLEYLTTGYNNLLKGLKRNINLERKEVGYTFSLIYTIKEIPRAQSKITQHSGSIQPLKILYKDNFGGKK